MRKIDRTGEIRVNNQGLKMTIIGYRRNKDVDVQFEDGYMFKNALYSNFKKGTIKNPYSPEVYDIGFVGVGKYKVSESGKPTKIYKTWQGMLERCYNEKYQKRQPTYIECSVCDEWHNFQNFAKWYEENIWDKDCTVLDKDILVKGNKIYSPNTSILVDQRINKLFIKCDKSRGKYPIGVSYHKNTKKFRVMCNVVVDGKSQRKHLGLYSTQQKAFQVYKQFKEAYIKQVADEYKEKYMNLPNNLHKAMHDYKIEIND